MWLLRETAVIAVLSAAIGLIAMISGHSLARPSARKMCHERARRQAERLLPKGDGKNEC